MKTSAFVLAITCMPLMLNAAENGVPVASGNPWIINNVLYSAENCGEPVAYLDASGNILSRIDLADQALSGSEKR